MGSIPIPSSTSPVVVLQEDLKLSVGFKEKTIKDTS